ncbi:flotillin-like protein 4 [Mercurialis annua]|uniref:flotillin-like protein 4 n=1 Tax=Mercurialis annua TaxID=3986 RepID=UPI002160A151|nr:flotillin-like protein 4 [Mercurialis annua]
MWHIAGPSEYLAITGAGIHDIKLAKKSWIWPMQKCSRFDVSPVNYTFEVQAMSAEKLPFLLPAVFTIGPRVDSEDSLIVYARLMSTHDQNSNHVNELVQGVIEGETRVLAASMTMEEIFRGTKDFKQEVFGKVQLELNQFGLIIYNANVKQLVDVRGQEYFSYLGQKIQTEAANQAKVDVAEATMKGETGAKTRQGLTAQNAAKIDAETKIISTQRQGEGQKEEIKVKTDVKIFQNQKEAEVAEANAELATKKAGWAQASQLAEVESSKAVAIREAELQTEVERKNAMARTENLKAELLSKATVDYETKVQEANWELYKKQREVDAVFYQKQKDAEAQKANADAALYARQQAANGEVYAKQKEAEGIQILAEAKGIYLGTLLKQLGGNYGALRDFMMLDKNLFQDVAKINADAIKGLQPKISIWNNGGDQVSGGGGGGVGGPMKDIAGVYGMLPPLLQTVHEQTGMLPPAWLGTLPESGNTSSNKIYT